MNRHTVFRIWGLAMILVLIVSMLSLPANVQAQDDSEIFEAQSVQMAAPAMEEAVEFDEPPPLTEEQLANLQWGVENTPGALPVIEGEQTEPTGPAPGTESMLETTRAEPGAPLQPGTAAIYRMTNFGSSIPAGFKSNVMESSISDGKSKRMWFTGNWFAARTLNKGQTWSYVSSYADYPDFCCDQVTNHDATRDIYLWLRMGVPDGNGVNTFKLSVDFKEPFQGAYWTYTVQPTDVDPTWTNQWWDYPHVQLGADYVYITWNMFDQFGFYTRSVILRWPLDALATGAAFGYNYYATDAWASFVPVSGAHHTMYWASTWPNSAPQNSRIRIYAWPEDSTTITAWTKNIHTWTFTNRGDANCGTPNWAARYDQRALTGARYSIYSDGIAEPRQPGRNILGWWWNVGEGGDFALPYIDGVAFYESTMTQLPGWLGRPYMYNPDLCFAYPSFTPNQRGDLGGIFNFAKNTAYHKPWVGYTLADDYTWAPPGWFFYEAANSRAGPLDEKWGDYNTTRTYQGSFAWAAGTHIIPTTTNCVDCSVPLSFFFGRERDRFSWQIW